MNLRFWKKQELYGATISEAKASSQVSDNSLYQYVRPEVDFATCYEYYRTVGKVQNAVESYVAEILSRDWYFEGSQEAVKQLEEWEDRFNLSRLLEYMVRDWLVCGNSIVGVSDWQPVQMTSVAGMKRSPYGVAEQYMQLVNGREVALDATKFIHTQYIELNREAWGVGMFHSLLTTFGYGGKKRSLPQLEIYRRQIQLFYKVLERYGSPVTVWFFDNVSKAEFDRQVEELRALEAGDRRILSKKVEIATETIDGRGNLINATSPIINQEIEAGLQTSANRLITQPSAMADARSASEKDDVRGLLIAEKIRRVMNTLIIPRLVSGKAEFRWGKQDSFEFDFNQLLQAKSAGFVSAKEGRAMLQSVGWKLDDNLFNANQNQMPQSKQEDYYFLDERVRQIIYNILQEFNPYHDERGRFASAGGATNFSVSRPSRLRNAASVKANRELIKKRYDAVQNKLTNVYTSDGQKHDLYRENEFGVITNTKRYAVETGLMTASTEHLDKVDRIIVSENEKIFGEEAGVYISSTTPRASLDYLKNQYGVNYRYGDLGLAIGRDELSVYSTTVHETHHVQYDSMKNFGSSEEKAAIGNYDHIYSELLKSDYPRSVNFKKAYGGYGTPRGRYNDLDEQEGFSSMGEAYWVRPRLGSIISSKDNLENTKMFGELYFDMMDELYPDLKPLNDAFRKITEITQRKP